MLLMKIVDKGWKLQSKWIFESVVFTSVSKVKNAELKQHLALLK